MKIKYFLLFSIISSLALFSAADCFAKSEVTASTSTVKSGGEEEQPITEESPETNPDKDKLTLPETQAEAFAQIQRKNERSALRLRIRQSEALFDKAVKSYEKGSAARALDNFNASMVELSSANANFDASVFYGLKDDYKDIFSKLQKSLLEATTVYVRSGKKYIIPMDTDNDIVQKYIKLYSEGKAKPVIQKALTRSGRYRPMITQILKEYDLPEELIYLPVVESLYSVNDLSCAGALGLWQLMPDTGRGLGLKVNYWIDERKDPEKSTRAAAQYLKELYNMFDDWHLALAAYNRGEFGLGRDLKFSRATNICEMKSRNAVPRETQSYVPQFIASTIIGDNPGDYGFDTVYDQPVFFDKVKVDKIVDLKIAAECAGTSLEVIRELNPALKAWCTPHGYPEFELNIPSGTKEAFIANIAKVKELNPSSGFIKYKIVKRDTLGKIAKQFGTSVNSIKDDNHIKNPRALRIGQVLIVRPGRKYMGK